LAGETVSVGPIWYGGREPSAADERRVAVETVMFPIFDATGTVAQVALVFKDVTAEQTLRAGHDRLDALRRRDEALHQTQKLEAMGKLAGGIAHDFNNLLSVILSYTALGIESLDSGDPLRSDLEEAKLAGERAADLTRQLLAFSRRQVLKPTVVDLNAMLFGMEKQLLRTVGDDVTVIFLVASTLGSILADPSQVEQLVINLAANARDAMPRGGRLTIETANVELDAARADALGVPPGPYVMLALADTGVGMDASTREQVFEPFFTTKERGKGRGLGLSTAFGIVSQSGGTIRVESELGAGTTFRIHFPRVKASQPIARPSTTPPPNLRGTETILLVEDEEQVRVLARTVLRRHGYEVLEAENARDAFLLCESHPSRIHLLLTDILMPRMTGDELAERLTTVRPGLKILYMSGYTDDAVFQRGLSDPGVAFLQKPLTPPLLVAKVREVLDEPG
jgi:signal transduction histidine kinase